MAQDHDGPPGALIGYARVSTGEQNLDRQLHALREAGCTRVYTDKLSGKNTDRPELGTCLDYLRAGDQLVVTSLDRLSRSVRDLTALVEQLHERGIEFATLTEQIDTATPTGELTFHIFGAINQFIRRLIVAGTNEGLAAARRAGTQLGRPPALDAEDVAQARLRLARPGETVTSVATHYGVSRSTLYKYVPELHRGGTAAVRDHVQDEALAAYGAAPTPGDTRIERDQDEHRPPVLAAVSEPAATHTSAAAPPAPAGPERRDSGRQDRRATTGGVTEPVTDTDPRDASPAPATPAPARGRGRGGKNAGSSRTRGTPRAAKPREHIDLDSIEQILDHDAGRWRVQARTQRGTPVLVGFLDRDGIRQTHWRACTPNLTVTARGFRTKKDALTRLIESHAPPRRH